MMRTPFIPSRTTRSPIPSPLLPSAELVVFPETFVPYYPYFSFVLPPVLQGAPHLKLMERAVVVPDALFASVSVLESPGRIGFLFVPPAAAAAALRPPGRLVAFVVVAA